MKCLDCLQPLRKISLILWIHLQIILSNIFGAISRNMGLEIVLDILWDWDPINLHYGMSGTHSCWAFLLGCFLWLSSQICDFCSVLLISMKHFGENYWKSHSQEKREVYFKICFLWSLISLGALFLVSALFLLISAHIFRNCHPRNWFYWKQYEGATVRLLPTKCSSYSRYNWPGKGIL